MPHQRLAVLFAFISTGALAQWLNYPSPGTPRTQDGKPNLTAAAPRTAEGKPDLSGVWMHEITGVADEMVTLQDIFVFDRLGVGPNGRVLGRFRATGARPICLDRLKAYGIHLSASIFQEEHEVKEK